MKFELPSGDVVLLDDADAHLLEGLRWHADRREHTTYVRGRKPGQHKGGAYLHNLIIGGLADHKDGNGLDCRRQNIRPATQAQNGLNTGPKRKHKRFKGVSKPRGKRGMYYAELYIGGARYASYGHLTEESAALAYDALARQHHGEFARLNFPEAA